MSTRLEIRRVDRVVVEAIPFFELLLGERMRLRRFPLQHGLVEVETDGSTVLLHHTSWIVQHIVGVKNTDLNFARLGLDTLSILLAADFGTNHARILEVVKKPAQLVITRFLRHEGFKLGPFNERRNAASIIAWNRVLWVANKECEVKLLQDFPRHNRRITRLCDGILVWERRVLRRRRWAARRRGEDHAAIVVTVEILPLLRGIVAFENGQPIRADAALDSLKRWCDGCGLSIWRKKIVGDVFDEDTFALISVSTLIDCRSSRILDCCHKMRKCQYQQSELADAADDSQKCAMIAAVLERCTSRRRWRRS